MQKLQSISYFFLRVRICKILCVLIISLDLKAGNFKFQETQDTVTKPTIAFLWGKSNALHNTKQYDELLAFLEKHLKNIQPKNQKDSLDVADLYYNQFQGNFYTGKYLESIKSANKGMPYCGKATSKRAKHNKGVLYYKRAYGEAGMDFAKRAQLSMKTALEYLSEDDESSLDYLVDAYVFLSSQAAYHGNLPDAKRNIRMANKTYDKHRKHLDEARRDRYEVVLAYREAYLLYKLATTKEDSLEIVNVVNKLNTLQASPKFNKHEYIYYSTALNHIGDWYISYKHDSLITSKKLETGSYYLDKSIDLVENKNYTGDLISFKYNKCKALTLANDLQKAESLMEYLLDSMNKNDYRRSFFLAQKGLIKAKLKQKDSALRIFHNVIERIHSDSTTLAKDYSNFKPSKTYGESRLIRRVAEKLEEFYNDDPEVKKTIARLYRIAFIQFENSYAKTKFNPNQNDVLREILNGSLLAQKEGFDEEHLSINQLLGRTETIMNQMTWQRFYQNRFTNKLPELDSLKFRHLNLRTLLTAAKKENSIRKVDSLQELINNHLIFTNKKFPNLELLSSKKFDIETLQRNLRDNELVLKYFILNTKIAIFSISANDIHWEIKSWTADEIELGETLINSIRDRKYDAKTAALLGEKLLPTIDPEFTKIIINPDGELYRIPFEILQLENKFFIETHEIRYTSNLGFTHFENNSQPTTKGLLAIYAPNYPETEAMVATRSDASFLKGAKKEAEIISKLFPSETYIGDNISKKYFLDTAPKAGVLHLAMHAVINNEEPGLSRLLFNKNNQTDDDLYLEELYALQLQADLAVLSACNTGLGKESAGRNLESFQRAFTFSGVPATVVSLWEVPDQSTSKIMESFYTYLKDGYTKSAALKNAKLNYLRKHKGTKLEQPFYWTGFILYGDESTISIAASSNVIWHILFVVMIVLTILIFKKRLKYNATS
ncbi:CHAT domain-containing protein [Kordia sp.]|uniref:CHAT domain-containing protein n=1 Tax=Kordia sp. TaxID=1965332 RepID=UPI0025BE00E8|nr:CHAT domain-containing protein [Kordia sp.]MCH2194460.1 CHAT domain-containing protein [Kordia sp.]